MKIDFYHKNSTSIWLSLVEGRLAFDIYDYNHHIKKIMDEFENEGEDEDVYFLTLDKENTTKLFDLLGISDKTDRKKLEYIKKRFKRLGKDKGVSDFKEFCKENNIKTEFSCWYGIC